MPSVARTSLAFGHDIHPRESMMMIYGFQVISQWLATDRNAMCNDLSCLTQRQRIPLDCVRTVGQFKVDRFTQGRQKRGRKESHGR